MSRTRRLVALILAAVALAIAVVALLPPSARAGLAAGAAAVGRVLTRPFLTVAGLSLTLSLLVKVAVLLALLGVIARRTARLLETRVLVHTSFDPGQRYAVSRFVSYLVFALGLLIGLESLGVNLNSLLVVGGALGIGIGFGLQTVVANLVSGLILLIERPVKLGDRIQVGETVGDVVRIGARSSWVRTNANVVIIVPNSEFLNQRVVNWTANDPRARFELQVGVAYSSDPAEVRRLLLELARRHPDVLASPEPEVLFTAFGDSSLDFLLRVWTVRHVQTPAILKSDLYFAIFTALKERGIEIPFPQRDLHLRSAEAPLVLARGR
jgi:small-conductance mechanosensitive channel